MLLLPNMWIIAFMVVSVKASARVWCWMCSDLERDQARKGCSGWGWGGHWLLIGDSAWIFGKLLPENSCPGLIHSSSSRRCPPRISPYKAEGMSFGQPCTTAQCRCEDRFAISGLIPKCWPVPAPGKSLTP